MPKKRSHGDGGLFYIKSRKLWRGTVDLPPDPITGKRRQKHVHAKKQADARAKLDALKREIVEHGAPLDRNVTIGAWAPHWLDTYKKPSIDPQTYSGYASAINKWIAPVLGGLPVASVKPSDVVAVQNAMRTAGRSSSLIRSVYRVLSMLLEQARREGLTARNVAADVDMVKRSTKTRDSIPLDDAARMLEMAARVDVGSMWWFKLLGGPRQTEILGATLDSLDLDAGLFRVNWKLEEVPREHGCGEHSGGVWPCGKKNGAACPDARWRIPDDFDMRHLEGRWCLTRPKSVIGRTIPLIPQLVDMIGAYLDRHKDDPNPHNLIWRHEDGRPITKKEDAQEWRNLLLAAGLIAADQLAPGKSEITGHWARHTTVTLLASLGVDAQLIGEIVGHSSREVTEIYRHADHSEKTRAMTMLGAHILGTPPAIEP